MANDDDAAMNALFEVERIVEQLKISAGTELGKTLSEAHQALERDPQ